jgi:murein endopeptidase
VRVKAVAVAAMVACAVVLGVVGAGTFAQTPPPPAPTVTTMPPGPVPVPAPTASTPGPAAAPPAAPTGPSRAIGQPWHGRLVNGVQLPEVSADWLTWDPVLKQIPNRPERRWGTAKLIATIKRVLASWHLAHPEMPQLLIGDLSRPHGGVFDQRYGGLGHASHQNGLDADIYYPRRDHRLLAAYKPELIDRSLAQDLLDRFVAEGVQFVFIGTRTHLHGPRKVVQVIAHHNDHMHVRIFRPTG